MSFLTDYFQIQQHFTDKYDDKTVVFIQKGAHYQVYEYDPICAKDQLITNQVSGSLALHLSFKDSKIQVQEFLELNKNMGKAKDISLILGMKLTSPDKSKTHSISNPFMMGFPQASYDSHRDIILLNGFTIIRIDEVGDDLENKGKKREVVEITSPGTELDKSISFQNTNTLVSIYIEYQKNRSNIDQTTIVSGLSSIEISTGETVVSEVYSKHEDEVYAIQEIYRFLACSKPVEILIHVNKIPPSIEEEYLKYLEANLDLGKYSSVIFQVNKLNPDFSKPEYQETFLRKAYSGLQKAYSELQKEYLSSSSESPVNSEIKIIHQQGPKSTVGIIEELDLEMFHYGRISFICLLQHCYEHRENCIQKLQNPQINWTDQKSHLILTHNAIDQLDLFPKRFNYLSSTGRIGRKGKQNIDSLIRILDSTLTDMGSRFLQKRLLNPITNIQELELNYSMTQELIESVESVDSVKTVNEENLFDSLLSKLEFHFKNLPDVEKLHRKVQLNIIKPKELVILIKSYVQIQDIYSILFHSCYSNSEVKNPALSKLFLSHEQTQDFNSNLIKLYGNLDLDKLDQVQYSTRGKTINLRSEESFIIPGRDNEIDYANQKLLSYRNLLDQICQYLNKFIPGARSKKVEIHRESDGQHLLITSKASVKHLKAANIQNEICGQLEFVTFKANSMEIRSDKITECCSNVLFCQEDLDKLLLVKYHNIVQELGNAQYFSALNHFLALSDFLINNARLALKYRYFRPQIDQTKEKAFIDITGLRHPLIERILNSEYIPNDVQLGLNYDGILQYGVNSSGKSSLAKAIGIAVIMAQAGMFVAGKMSYKPYNKIITRLSGHDDILKGQSSFVVEMMELKTILQNSDKNTLVFGDELCRGTETVSGESLTCTTIEELLRRNTSFIFSTHMHGLIQLEPIKKEIEAKRLRIFHLTTHFNEQLGKLVYDRKLQEGSGSPIYGLEVCKSLNLPLSFVQRAEKICRDILGKPENFVSTKKSRYNSRIYVDKCSLCGIHLQLNTHHLKEQHKADERGFIENYHKDSSFNLLVLCESCHRKIHTEHIQLSKQQTLNGVYLVSNQI